MVPFKAEVPLPPLSLPVTLHPLVLQLDNSCCPSKFNSRVIASGKSFLSLQVIYLSLFRAFKVQFIRVVTRKYFEGWVASLSFVLLEPRTASFDRTGGYCMYLENIL